MQISTSLFQKKQSTPPHTTTLPHAPHFAHQVQQTICPPPHTSIGIPPPRCALWLHAVIWAVKVVRGSTEFVVAHTLNGCDRAASDLTTLGLSRARGGRCPGSTYEKDTPTHCEEKFTVREIKSWFEDLL
jgi:hypothetical protein